MSAEAVRLTDRTGETDLAWRELFTATYPTLAGWVRRLVDDDETAHEIASEAFTRLMSHWSRPEHPQAYLYKIAANLVRDHWRQTRRDRIALRGLAARGVRLAPAADSAANLRAMLEPLPDRQRSVVVLHYLAGLSIHDIAVALGRPEGTIKSDLHQARLRLRSDWDDNRD
jgi:RNA polymerase sigma-70 factor (ECF subfamily)